MTKLILSLSTLLIVLGFAAKAQNLTLLDPSNGNVLSTPTSMATITVHGDTSETELVSIAWVRNNSSSALDVKAKRYNLGSVTGSTNALCWGSCFAPGVSISPNSISIAANKTDSASFASHFRPNHNTGVSTYMFTFYNIHNTADSVSITYRYDISLTDIPTFNFNGCGVSQPYPSPANASVSFNCQLKNGSKGFLAIYNMLGEEVKKYEVLTTGVLKIATYDLIKGAYIYRYMVDDKNIKTGKLIISR